MQLKTNYKDDLFAHGIERRKYNMIQNPDGTVSFEDKTPYEVLGDNFGSKDINETNREVNRINSDSIKTTEELEKVEAPGNMMDAMAGKAMLDKMLPLINFSGKNNLVGSWGGQPIYCSHLEHSWALDQTQAGDGAIQNTTKKSPLFWIAFLKHNTYSTVYMLPWMNEVYIDSITASSINYKNTTGWTWPNYTLHILLFHF